MIEELCLAGGGQKGIVFLGFLKKLEDMKILTRDSLKKIVGVSSGSLILACYIIGYSFLDLYEIIHKTDTISLLDIELEELSIIQGEVFKKWVSEIISKKVDKDITLRELYEKIPIHFIITTTCLQTGLVYMDKDMDVKLIDALMCSTRVPFLFPPYEIGSLSYIDGGVLNNYPINILSKKAIGIKLKGSEKNHKNLTSYIASLIHTVTRHIETLMTNTSPYNIVIPTKSGLINFHIDGDDKLNLFLEGYNYDSELIHKFVHDKKFEKIIIDLGNRKKEE